MHGPDTDRLRCLKQPQIFFLTMDMDELPIRQLLHMQHGKTTKIHYIPLN